MTRALLNSCATLPMYRDTMLLNCLQRGGEGEGRRRYEKGGGRGGEKREREEGGEGEREGKVRR